MFLFIKSNLLAFGLLLMLTSCGGGGGGGGGGSASTNPDSSPPRALGKYEPEDGKVLMFIGQDNKSVGGGNTIFGADVQDDGYLDAGLTRPAGITAYIGFGNVGTPNPDGTMIRGLTTAVDFGGGPGCVQCYIDGHTLDWSKAAIHLSIYYAGRAALTDEVGNGDWDDEIMEVAQFLLKNSSIPFFIRPGYEFDVQYKDNGVSGASYQRAFRRVVDMLRDAGVTNFASVYSSASTAPRRNTWQEYYPGDDYVDWFGYSLFGQNFVPTGREGLFKLAGDVGKPIMIAEACWADQAISDITADTIWVQYFVNMFANAEAHPTQVKAIAYINADWREQSLWDNVPFFDETDSRIQAAALTISNWQTKLTNDRFINEDDDIHTLIRFNE